LFRHNIEQVVQTIDYVPLNAVIKPRRFKMKEND